jgi:tetratricopeptide (TPR) repeat protein
MKSDIQRIALISFLLIFLIPNLAFPENKIFIREYTYHAGDEDSKNSSRTIALREVKRLLLEELGTYLESETEVQNFQLTKDQITALTAGIVQAELLEEKWDGSAYWLKAKIQADSGEVVKSINALRKDRQKTGELEGIRRRSADLMHENERLRKELETAKGAKKQEQTAAYNKTIKELSAAEWFEKGYAASLSGNQTEAITDYGKAIELNPQFALAHNNRGAVYAKLGNHSQAIKDFDKAIQLGPKDAGSYHNRGNAYAELGNNNQAIKDYNKTIELSPRYANVYASRGVVYGRLGNHNQAIKDYDQALKLNPQDAVTYALRGAVYDKPNRYDQAVSDYSKAIDLSPQDARLYYMRGLLHYGNPGSSKQGIADWQVAARLGFKPAQDFLTRKGISW